MAIPPFSMIMHYEQEGNNRLEEPVQGINSVRVRISFRKVVGFDQLTTKEASHILYKELIPHCTESGVDFSKRLHVEKIQKVFAHFEANLEYIPSFISLHILASRVHLPDQDVIAALLLQGTQGIFHKRSNSWTFQARLSSVPLQLFA